MSEYIDREKAVDALLTEMCMTGYQSRAINVIRMIEKEDVAPVVHGKWKPTEYPIMSECEDCSECGYRTVYGHGFKFCPNCGAKMDVDNLTEK